MSIKPLPGAKARCRDAYWRLLGDARQDRNEQAQASAGSPPAPPPPSPPPPAPWHKARASAGSGAPQRPVAKATLSKRRPKAPLRPVSKAAIAKRLSKTARSTPPWASAAHDQGESARKREYTWKPCARPGCKRFVAEDSFPHCCCYCRSWPDLGHASYCLHRQPTESEASALLEEVAPPRKFKPLAHGVNPFIPPGLGASAEASAPSPPGAEIAQPSPPDEAEENRRNLASLEAERKAYEYVMARLRVRCGKKASPEPEAENFDTRGLRSVRQDLQTHVAALKSEMGWLDAEAGAEFLEEYWQWQEEGAYEHWGWDKFRPPKERPSHQWGNSRGWSSWDAGWLGLFFGDQNLSQPQCS